MLIAVFLSSGLFLGWSLGANDAANVFGTAIGSRMVKFKTAAIITSIFVILGAAISGAGAAGTLTDLGSVDQIAGAFVVCLSAAFTIYFMTKLNLPVSTSQAIVGAIVGWNFFSGSLTDLSVLSEIILTWILCPVLAAIFSIILYKTLGTAINRMKIHILLLDYYTRAGLVIAGAFSAYSLGANNIANVMGVFVPVSPFKTLDLGFFYLTSIQQLFILGGIAIAVGVFTYSYRVMQTVGTGILKLRPETALIVVFSAGLVLFLFASETIELWLASRNLPTLPLVPVSSSQAIVGGILGIGLVQGGKGINYNILGRISSGWVTTPIIAGIISFTALFFVQNVFLQKVYSPQELRLEPAVIERLAEEGINSEKLKPHLGENFSKEINMYNWLKEKFPDMADDSRITILRFSQIKDIEVDTSIIATEIETNWLSPGQLESVQKIDGQNFRYSWEFKDRLKELSDDWEKLPDITVNKLHNRAIDERINYMIRMFTTDKQI